MIYFLIFIAKIVENTLSTLRLIVVSNGKKKLGAFLQGLIAIVWVISTGIVIVDINKDLLKIVFFCLGSLVGSYLGSLIEEKIALGSNMVLSIIDKSFINIIQDKLNNEEYHTTLLSCLDEKKCLLLIMVKRKHISYILNEIKQIDKNAIVISEKARTISDKFLIN